MLLRRALLIAIAALSVGALLPSGAAAKPGTKWLCKPGLERDPCRTGLRTTLLSASGEPLRTSKPSRTRPRRIDCFYVYPTVSDQPTQNANRRIDPELRSIALYQAARYNQHCKVYAPVYRQVTLAALNGGGFTEEALAKAYRDVRRAWRAYRRSNPRRGVVLVGHSQGTFMLTRLLSEEIDPSRRARRHLVSALLLGGNVTVAEGGDRGGSFDRVRACRRARQHGCVVAFSTFDERPPADAVFGRTDNQGEEVLCTNPAALAGGSARLRYVAPSEPFAPGTTIGLGVGLIGAPFPEVGTPWFESRKGYVGRCSSAGGADVLRIRPREGAPDLRPIPDPTWGLHLADANIALGNLVNLVRKQSRAFLARR